MTAEQVTDRLTALRLIQSNRPVFEQAVHDAARRTHDESPLVVAQELGEYLGHPVDVTVLCDLGEQLRVVEYGDYSGAAEGLWHRRRIEGLTSQVLVGAGVIR